MILEENLQNLVCFSVISKNVKCFEDFNIKNIDNFYNQASKISGLDGLVFLQKCNAIEVYAFAQESVIVSLVHLWKEQSFDSVKFDIDLAKKYTGEKCIEHLLQTACGLKSVVLGDNQVLGQINNAFKISTKYHAAKPVLTAMFSKVRDSANTIRKQTSIGGGHASVSRVSVDLFIEEKPDKNSSILLIGAGEISELVAKCLNENGFLNVTVANRTLENAQKILTKKYAISAITLSDAYSNFDKFNYVFSGISVPISMEVVRDLNFSKTIMVFDLGNPRNTVNFPKTLKIVTINDIQDYAQKIVENREKKIDEVNQIIKKRLCDIMDAINKKILNLEIQKNYNWMNSRIDKDFIRDYSGKNEFQFGIRQYLYDKKFVEVQTPCVVAVPSDPIKKGSEQETFHLNWYGRKMFLRQSNQLHKQMLVLGGFDKIFELGPFWRSESNFTPRHLAEAWGLDVELANVFNVDELLTIVGEILHNASKRMADKKYISQDDIIEVDFLKLKYKDAVALIKKNNIPYTEGTDLGYEVEKALGEVVEKKYKTNIFAITHYPDTIKKFYTKTNEHQTETFDVFFHGWEISSGAVRQDDGVKLKNALTKAGLDVDKYGFYLEKFNHSRAHGGFCLGVDRIISKLLNKNHVKEVVLYPRSQTHIIP